MPAFSPKVVCFQLEKKKKREKGEKKKKNQHTTLKNFKGTYANGGGREKKHSRKQSERGEACACFFISLVERQPSRPARETGKKGDRIAKKKVRCKKEKKRKRRRNRKEKTLVCGKRLNAIAFSIPERARGETGGIARNEGRDRWSKTITYPSCPPGAHFHPSERGKESHRLRYANYPP